MKQIKTALYFFIILSAYGQIVLPTCFSCVSGAVDAEDELYIRGKFSSELLERIHVLNLTDPETYLSLIIRLSTNTTGLNNTLMKDLKNNLAHLLTNNHNSTVYSVCRILPFIMAKVPITEAEKIALYDFVESISDGNRKGYFALNVSRSAIQADYVRTSLGFNGSGVRIAIVDSGMDTHHPDLNDLDDDPTTPDPKVLDNISFFDIDDDGNPDEGPDDNYGHGTHVAGISAGTGEASNYQFVGVAPGAWILNIKVGSVLGIEEDDAINGIDYALDNGADVINLSFAFSGGDGTSPVSKAVDDAVEKGAVVVAGVGNDGPTNFTITSPADAFNVIAVGAVDDNNTPDVADDVLLNLSSRGPTEDGRPKPDVVAPGVRIISCRATGTDIRQPGWDSYISPFYVECTGTSMAAPHVAGTVALMLHANPNLTPAQVKAILRQTANLTSNLAEYDVNDRGHGIIDAYAAVQLTQNVNNIDRNQMYDSWEATTPNHDLGWLCYDYLSFTVDAPDPTFGISVKNIQYHYRHPLGIGNIDYKLIQRLSAQHLWIDGTYYHLGNDMHKYLFSGPRIYARGDGYTLLRALYKVGNVKIEYFWNIGVDFVLFRLIYYGGSSWKTLMYIDTDIWNETNYPYLPSTSETILIERKITNFDWDNPVNVRDLAHTEYLRIEPYEPPIGNPIIWILKHGYLGNNPDEPTVKNDEYIYNRNLIIYYQDTSLQSGVYIYRKTDTLPPPDPTQNDAGLGGDAGDTIDTCTTISPGSYKGILCNSDPVDTNDCYEFYAQNGKTIYVSVTPPPNIDFNLELYDPIGNLKAWSSNGAGCTDSIFYNANLTGLWPIRIYIQDGEGQYSFYVSVNSHAYAMKTTTAGHFYIPHLDINILRIKLLFDNPRIEGDQTGNSSLYPTIINWPDTIVDGQDYQFVKSRLGEYEGSARWDYMADINADGIIDAADWQIVKRNLFHSGNYTDVLTGVTVVFNTGYTTAPDTNGYIIIPNDVSNFTVYKNGNTIGAMIIFWET